MQPNRLLAIFAIVVVLIVLALYLTSDEERFWEPENTGPPEVTQQAPDTTAEPEALPQARSEVAAVGPGAMPSSLRGVTPPSGWQRIDGDQLRVSPALRRLFDHYLVALGEVSLEQVQALIESDLAQLPDAARQQALQILGGYLEYKAALASVEAGMPGQALDADQMRLHVQRLRDLRRSLLGPSVSDAFFASEEVYEDFALARLEQDPAPGNAADRLRELEAQMPEPVRKEREQTRTFTDYRDSLEQLQASGADGQVIRQLREERFGVEGAQRLAALDRQRQDWARRFGDYTEARQALDAAGLAGVDRDAAVDRLRRDYFTEQEIARARALDQDRTSINFP